METRRWIVAGEYIKTTSAVAGCATFIIGNVRDRQREPNRIHNSFFNRRLRGHRAPHVPRLPAGPGLLLLPRPPLPQLVAGPVQRLQRRDGAQAEAHPEGALIHLGLRRGGQERFDDNGPRRAGQEGGIEGAQIPRADCDCRIGSLVRLVANTIGQCLEQGHRPKL